MGNPVYILLALILLAVVGYVGYLYAPLVVQWRNRHTTERINLNAEAIRTTRESILAYIRQDNRSPYAWTVGDGYDTEVIYAGFMQIRSEINALSDCKMVATVYRGDKGQVKIAVFLKEGNR